jgi:hypothetical protein
VTDARNNSVDRRYDAEKVGHAAMGATTWRPGTKDFWQRDSRWEVFHREAVRRALLGMTETLVAEFLNSASKIEQH